MRRQCRGLARLLDPYTLLFGMGLPQECIVRPPHVESQLIAYAGGQGGPHGEVSEMSRLRTSLNASTLQFGRRCQRMSFDLKEMGVKQRKTHRLAELKSDTSDSSSYSTGLVATVSNEATFYHSHLILSVKQMAFLHGGPVSIMQAVFLLRHTSQGRLFLPRQRRGPPNRLVMENLRRLGSGCCRSNSICVLGDAFTGSLSVAVRLSASESLLVSFSARRAMGNSSGKMNVDSEIPKSSYAL